jgi:hypothetical protein
MLGSGTRDARRTERYLDGLTTADDRRASEVPVDVDVDPAVRFAARELRDGLTRVHPSFRFEEALAARLATGAARQAAGVPVEEPGAAAVPGTLAQFRGRPTGGTDALVATAVPAALTAFAATTATEAADSEAAGPAADGSAPAPASRARAIWPAAAFRLPEMAARQPRPLIVGGVGVGVASAAISLGAVFVAWRHSHPAASRMGRAAREAHGRTAQSGRGRRPRVIDGILGVVS